MDGFNANFSFAELTYSSGHPELVSQNRKDAVRYRLAGKRLSKLLGSVREVLGNAPIKVTSGFRNNDLNKAVGSKAKSSAHLRFEAADIIPTNMSVQEAFDVLMEAKKRGELEDLRKCIIEMNRWLHIEVSMEPGDYKGFMATTDGKTFHRLA